MQRGLLVASIAMMLVHHARPSENARAMWIRVSPETVINSETGAALVNYALANVTWSPLYPRSKYSPSVFLEHYLDDRWLTHRRLDMNCVDGSRREAAEGINHGAPCLGQLRVVVPGKYRVRVLLNAGAESLSSDFRVLPPRQVDSAR